ncbi:MAG: isoprenylcysteine carboxylmethyltransferase family protein [Anaerolineales bacterium]|nr:isoprenylcysteine carboxylmethyltransferase family protein [Anaerolineales bacterium]
MNNFTKWLIALPFTVFATIAVPALVAGNPRWFIRHWTDLLFATLSAGMWLIATAFVDVNVPRGSPDRANRLIPLGLLLAVPIAVWDRTHWIASTMPIAVKVFGILLSALAVVLGVAARISLGRSYSPRASHDVEGMLVQKGPYRWIRHPLYAAAILWTVGWPLIMASFLSSIISIVLVGPAIRSRMIAEEAELLLAYGEPYAIYQKSTWRIFPYIY